MACQFYAFPTMAMGIGSFCAAETQGAQLKDGQRVDGLLEGYVCVLKRLDRSRYREHLGYAR